MRDFSVVPATLPSHELITFGSTKSGKKTLWTYAFVHQVAVLSNLNQCILFAGLETNVADQTCTSDRDWIPIVCAVLRFADKPTVYGSPSEEENPFSREAFERFRRADRPRLTRERKRTAPDELTRILLEKTQAQEVEIDFEAGAFKFVFAMPEGGASVHTVSPSAILDRVDAAPAVEPRVLAESLFNTEGLVRIPDESAKRHSQRHQRVLEAIGLVWRQYLLRDFDREVSEGRVRIYGRIGSPIAPFQQLPAELWARLVVLQWQHGIARDFEGTTYYALHAASDLRALSNGKNSLQSDETAAKRELAEELKKSPEMSRAQARSWCETKGYRVSKRAFLDRIWPNARTTADLPARAPAGRKKSKR